jgi:hypothetical protein
VALTVGLTFVAALLLLLAVPIHVHLAVEREGAVQARARLSWLFGLVRARAYPGAARARPKQAKRRPARRRSGLGTRIARRVAGGLLRADFRARSVTFLRDVLRAVRPRNVRLSARIGLDDPADTGRLWAALGPLGALLAHRDVRLEPGFDEACLRFRAAAHVRLIPAQLLFLIAAFLASPPVIRALVAR